MIGLILLFFAGKAFYDLAASHNRSKWGYAILGVISYYGGLFAGGIIIVFVYEFGFLISIDHVNESLVSLMSLPAGVLTCWGFYKLLERAWNKAAKRFESEEVLDAEIPREQNNQ